MSCKHHAIHSLASVSRGEKLYFVISISDNMNSMTDTRGNAALSERGFQCHLCSEAGAVHGEHVRWRWLQLPRQKFYCGGQPRVEFRPGQMKAPDNLGHERHLLISEEQIGNESSEHLPCTRACQR